MRLIFAFLITAILVAGFGLTPSVFAATETEDEVINSGTPGFTGITGTYMEAENYSSKNSSGTATFTISRFIV